MSDCWNTSSLALTPCFPCSLFPALSPPPTYSFSLLLFSCTHVHTLAHSLMLLSPCSRSQEVQQKYEAMLQMYGEKAEETEELKLDIQDLKTMYRQQVSILRETGKIIDILIHTDWGSAHTQILDNICWLESNSNLHWSHLFWFHWLSLSQPVHLQKNKKI